MGKIREWYRSIPIWLAMCIFIALALLISSFISGRVTSLFSGLAMEIQFKYATVAQSDDNDLNDSDIIYEITDDSGDGAVEISLNYDHYSDEDWQTFQRYSFIAVWSPLFVYSICILAAVLLFYSTKLKKPMKLLTKASSSIAENALDFSLEYSGYDEMAKLCAAFEKMRTALDENNRRMLHMIDERKQLNDAYTHDLRTPIAVLKGYTDMMTKYLPDGKMSQEEVLETVRTMSAHVSRLEQFVDSMNTAQKLEDVSIRKETVDVCDFFGQLRQSADILCKNSGLSCKFETSVSVESLFLDPTVVVQVYENLMSNAIRFAKSEVTVCCSVTEDAFSISVTDDGIGFSEKDMRKADVRACFPADASYYSRNTSKQGDHFGLGLYICQILCEKHGGSLELKNSPNGGACVIAIFSIK